MTLREQFEKETGIKVLMKNCSNGLEYNGRYVEYLETQLEAVKADYQGLIMAVESKHEGETRHETALRYIKSAENQDNGPKQGERND